MIRPILFSTDMVRAIIDGRKTQTRWVIKESYNGCWTNGGPHPCPNEPVVFHPGEFIESPIEGEDGFLIDGENVEAIFHCSTLDSVARCPFGMAGSILWVRETFAIGQTGHLWFKADTYPIKPKTLKWRPSIHLKRNDARLFLKVKQVKVERLCSISKDDAIAEGIFQIDQHPLESFRSLWESINGAGSWDEDPWVWVIEFERYFPEQDMYPFVPVNSFADDNGQPQETIDESTLDF